jgi:hypothetical protein
MYKLINTYVVNVTYENNQNKIELWFLSLPSNGGDIQLSSFPLFFKKIINSAIRKKLLLLYLTIGSIVMDLVLEITDHRIHNIPMLTFPMGFSHIISNRYFIEISNG